MKKIVAKNRGFTLLEILLYLGISSVVLFAIMSFSLQILGINKKSSNTQEIQTSMEVISNRLSTTIQSASTIDMLNSIFDQDVGKISLTLNDIEKSPTDIYLQNENIYLKQGANSAVKMNSDFVKCTQLKFTEISAPKAPTQVMIDYACAPINSDLQVLKDNFTHHTSISLRQ